MDNITPSHRIALAKAVEMTQRYRQQRDRIMNGTPGGPFMLPISETFSRDAFDRLLAQPGCVGVRIYNGMDEQGTLHSILVGVNEKDEDMLIAPVTVQTEATGTLEAEIIEDSGLCPPACAPASPLNS